MQRLSILFLMTLMIWVGLSQNSFAQGTNTCSGYTSTGNPYPCCSAGNCTWWAWKMAKDNWADPLPSYSWHYAWQWKGAAKTDHYGVASTPAVGTIGVNTTVNGTGHVAWVYAVDNTYVYVTEMNCDITKGRRYWKYTKTWFNGGYIYPRPRINSISPSPTWALFNRTYTLYGTGFKPNPVVKVTFPSGGYSYLSGTQVSYVNTGQMKLTLLLGASGLWSFQIQNKDGGWSNPWWVYVW